jgi:AcrR family transcriptional regulator
MRILAAAVDLFARHGYAGTSIRELADRLGMTKAALYYHFPSKEALLDELTAPLLGAAHEFVERARSGPPMTDAERVRAYCELLLGPLQALQPLFDDPAVHERLKHTQDLQALMTDVEIAMAGADDARSRLLARCALGALHMGVAVTLKQRRPRRAPVVDGALPIDLPDGGVPTAAAATAGLDPEEVDAVVAAALAALRSSVPEPCAQAPTDCMAANASSRVNAPA